MSYTVFKIKLLKGLKMLEKEITQFLIYGGLWVIGCLIITGIAVNLCNVFRKPINKQGLIRLNKLRKAA